MSSWLTQDSLQDYTTFSLFHGWDTTAATTNTTELPSPPSCTPLQSFVIEEQFFLKKKEKEKEE